MKVIEITNTKIVCKHEPSIVKQVSISMVLVVTSLLSAFYAYWILSAVLVLTIILFLWFKRRTETYIFDIKENLFYLTSSHKDPISGKLDEIDMVAVETGKIVLGLKTTEKRIDLPRAIRPFSSQERLLLAGVIANFLGLTVSVDDKQKLVK